MQGGRGLGEVIAEHGLIWQRLHAGDAMLGADTAAMVDGRPSTAAASSRSRLSSQRRRLWDSPEASKLHAAVLLRAIRWDSAFRPKCSRSFLVGRIC